MALPTTALWRVPPPPIPPPVATGGLCPSLPTLHKWPRENGTICHFGIFPLFHVQRPRPATGVSRARSVPGVSLAVSLGPFGPRSVQKVSRECPRSVRDTFLTLRGHSRDTFWTLRSPRPEGPQRHPEGHSRDTSGPKGPRDSCSRSGALQCFIAIVCLIRGQSL